MRPHKRLFTIVPIAIITAVIICLSLRVYQQHNIPSMVIPKEISGQLLFTPYVPLELPQDYAIQTSSFTIKENALLFSAINKSGQTMVISEQAVPKNFDIDSFYEQTMTKPSRIGSVANTTIFGQRKTQAGSIVSISTNDNTWIIATTSTALTRYDAQSLSQHLKSQK